MVVAGRELGVARQVSVVAGQLPNFLFRQLAGWISRPRRVP
jgi:hypothetical protein